MVTKEEIFGASPIVDPFNMENVTGVWLRYSPILKEWQGNIEFQNGDTSGKQEFREKGEEGFTKLVGKMQAFLEFIHKVS